MRTTFTIRVPLAGLLLLSMFHTLPAQQAEHWTRSVQPRVDKTVFSALDLPTPNRMRTASGAPGPDYWQQEASYKIDVSLDPATRLVHGREHVTYVNHSPDVLDYVWIQLEQNLLRADSIGARIGGGRAVGGPSEPSEGVKVLDLSQGGKALEYHVYDTLARVEVPHPIAAAGGTFEFDATWEFRVPTRVFRRYGTLQAHKGIVWEIAQWFPALAVYDDVHGWNTLPYLGTGEFYSNFGSYDVRITVPREHLVVATGVLQNEDEVLTAEQRGRLAQARKSETTVVVRGEDEVGVAASRPPGQGSLTWHFKADKVRSFAWASSEAFILDAAAYGDTLLQSAYTEEDLPAWGNSTQMLRAAIKGYSERWFPFPYPRATNVAGVEGGMEYPMIVFCRGRNERGLYGVTTHEIGHTWFPMVVNTDERRNAWMDEGFNTFINGYSTVDWFGSEGGGGRGGMMMMGAITDALPLMTPADQLNGMQLGLQYYKTGNALQLLREHVLGTERFDYAFRTYIRRWAFKSPQPADFFRTMEDAAGADLAWFWRSWFVESDSLDQAVQGVSQTEGHQARITFTNLSRMVMPLTWKVTFADDSTEEHELPVQVWFGTNRIVQRTDSDKQVRKVEIDPEHVMPDVDRSNNSWTPKG